jgi:hypothetical protein
MLRHEIYFFKNGVAVVAVNRDPTRKLPKPWPIFLNKSVDYVECHWVEFFAEFLMFHGENPSNFELHYPDGTIQRICWCPVWKRWSNKFDRESGAFLHLWEPSK